MPQKLVWPLAAVLILAAGVGCASGGGSPEFRREVGTASGPDTIERGLLVLRQHHFEVSRQEDTPALLVETHWRSREVFADEAALGIAEAESRVTISGRQRVDTLLGSVYSVTVVVQNRIRRAGGEQWTDTVTTPMFTAWAASLAGRLEEELRTIGVRRF